MLGEKIKEMIDKNDTDIRDSLLIRNKFRLFVLTGREKATLVCTIMNFAYEFDYLDEGDFKLTCKLGSLETDQVYSYETLNRGGEFSLISRMRLMAKELVDKQFSEVLGE